MVTLSIVKQGQPSCYFHFDEKLVIFYKVRQVFQSVLQNRENMLTGKSYCFSPTAAFQRTGAALKNSVFVQPIKNRQQVIDKECRICLSGGDQYSKLVKFCKCAGTIEYVHQNCLKEWITIKLSQKTDVVRCELCQQEFSYTKKSRKVFSCEQILSIAKRQPLSTFLKLLVYLCFLIGNVYFTYLLARATSEPPDGNLREKLLFSQKMAALYTVIIISIYITLIFLVIVLIVSFCIRQQVQIKILVPVQARDIPDNTLFPLRHSHKKIRIVPCRVHRLE